MDAEQLYAVRHSLAHVLAMAVLEVFPDAKLAIGPPIDTGFYYDFELPRALTPDDLPDLERRMRSILARKLSFTASTHTVDEAAEYFANQPLKLELIADLKAAGTKEVTYYQSGSFTDLCKGPHVATTSEIPPDAFTLSHAAGAYWRGDEHRPMLQRIYGLAFESKSVLDAYIQQQEQAKLRDHRRLGQELDLFTFSELVGSGLPLWTPKGNLLRILLDEYVWSLRQAAGYERVEIPHITKKELYVTSGHWEKFQHELFRIQTREGHEFVMKPMNCPHHTQIFARKPWSYREMPQRYSDTTMCYRDEQTGELNGLSRVRALTQDDAHVFCRYNQVKEELAKVWDIIDTFYGRFGFKLSIRLSFHDPANMAAYLGTAELWEETESQLKELVEERGSSYTIALGEAAFYGPKIDFLASDSLGRQWQVATIQLDSNQPQRFDLTYVDEQGNAAPVMMIHAAIMGSIERFLSVIIEDTAGNFPFWLSPVQVSILPVSDQFADAALKVAAFLKEAGLRPEVDLSQESVGKKIRSASLQKVPLKLVIGAKEVNEQGSDTWQVTPNWRTDYQMQGLEARSLAKLRAELTELSRQ